MEILGRRKRFSFCLILKQRLAPNDKKSNGKNSRLPKVPGIPKGQTPDVLWLNCATCQDLESVQDRSVSGRLNAMMKILYSSSHSDIHSHSYSGPAPGPGM